MAANGKDVRRCTPIADDVNVNACIGILLFRRPVATTPKRTELGRQHYRQNSFVPFGAPGYVAPSAHMRKRRMPMHALTLTSSAIGVQRRTSLPFAA